MKRKILIINWQDRTNPFFGGAEVHLHEIYGRLARREDYEITLLCASGAIQMLPFRLQLHDFLV